MTTNFAFLGGGAVVGFLWCLALWAYSQRVMLRRIRRTVTVRMKTGGHFHGVLWEQDRLHVVLKDAVALGVRDHGDLPMEGEIVVPRENVEYLQVT